MLDVSMVQKMLEPLFPGLMGVRLTELGPDRVLAEREVRADLCTAGGILASSKSTSLTTGCPQRRVFVARDARRRGQPCAAASAGRALNGG